MKKTIAKIMAAAMVLSTVVAPNVNAATSLQVAIDNLGLGRLPIQATSLNLSHVAATVNNNINSSDLISNPTIGSRNNPVEAGLVGDVGRDANGNISTVATDMYITATARGLDGNLLWFDAQNNINVVLSDNATTKVNASDFGNDKTGSISMKGNSPQQATGYLPPTSLRSVKVCYAASCGELNPRSIK